MIKQNGELTVLKSEQIYSYPFGAGLSKFGRKLKVFKDLSPIAAPTNLALLLGLAPDYSYVLGDELEPNPDSVVWNMIYKTYSKFGKISRDIHGQFMGVRPVMPIDKDALIDDDIGTYAIFGEFPQTVVGSITSENLTSKYYSGELKLTGRKFSLYRPGFITYRDDGLEEYEEYMDLESRRTFIRITTSFYNKEPQKLTNGVEYNNGDTVWVEVEPILWLMDEKAGLLISFKILLSGLMETGLKSTSFNDTVFYKYLNEIFIKQITAKTRSIEDMENDPIVKREDYHPQVIVLDSTKRFSQEEKKKYQFKKVNPFGFKLEPQTQEQTIASAMKARVAVFLHGKSSDGKSARVKQIDPDCEIVYLRNATPESLNGKSVYNAKTGEMKDIKPTWLVRLEEKCAKEPDKLHILFLDEIANALPSIQGIAFNIVLDREVNGRWKLPDNARIVAAGNEITDSLAAQPIAEPLFNRFAHVYIKTTTESWLRWASDMDIHPAIYAYIAYKKGEVLRTEYTGDKPNADPRKWEMASKMLYATNNPESIVSLVGEEITKEFIEFCKREVLTLEDVLNDNYDDKKIESLDTSERYATIIGLTQVDNKDVEKVIKFTKILGAEYEAVFESMWAANDEARLEIIAEIKMTDGSFSI